MNIKQMGKKTKIDKNKIISMYMGGEDLKYDISWEALMSVVIKINSFFEAPRPFIYGNPENVSLIIGPINVKIKASFWNNPDTVNGNHWLYLNKRFNYVKYTHLEAAYEAVFSFCNWIKIIEDGEERN